MRRGEATFAGGVLVSALAMTIGAMVAYGDPMTVFRFPAGAGRAAQILFVLKVALLMASLPWR